MHGEIRLGGWRRFTAEEVISWGAGMIWRARIRMGWKSITGSDSFLHGHGLTQWKLFGLLPFFNASGPDIDRSAAGRVNIESLWLPSVLCREGVQWSAESDSHLHAAFNAHGADADIDLCIYEGGGLRSFQMPRWGNPEGGEFRALPFGGLVVEEANFDGYTVPVRARIGWNPGTSEFDRGGEFFRATLDSIQYR